MMNECKDKYVVYSKYLVVLLYKILQMKYRFWRQKNHTHIFVFEQDVQDGLGDTANKTYTQKVAV